MTIKFMVGRDLRQTGLSVTMFLMFFLSFSWDAEALVLAKVSSASPNPIVVIPGGASVGMKITGTDLGVITKCVVYRNLNGSLNPVAGITATIGSLTTTSSGSSRVVTFLAVAGTPTGDAQLRVYSGTSFVDVPLTLLRISISSTTTATATKTQTLAPSTSTMTKTQTLAPSTSTVTLSATPALQTVVQTAPTTQPNVSGFSYDPVKAGGQITFIGQDFAADYFVAKIGTQTLNITSRSATRIEATLPSTPMVGDLTVGYGNPSSTRILKAGYRVINPVITGVQPTTFMKSDVVTVTGTDLFDADMQHISNSESGYIRVGNDYIKVSDWLVASDGRSLTFRVFDAYSYLFITCKIHSQLGSLAY